MWQTGNDPLVGTTTEEVALPTTGPAPIVVATPLMVVTTGVMVTGAPSVGIEIHGARAPLDEAAEDVVVVVVVVIVAEADVDPEVSVAVAVPDAVVDTSPLAAVEATKAVNAILPNSKPKNHPYNPVFHTQDPRPPRQQTRQEPRLSNQEDDALSINR